MPGDDWVSKCRTSSSLPSQNIGSRDYSHTLTLAALLALLSNHEGAGGLNAPTTTAASE
jgi:hypothetical protein